MTEGEIDCAVAVDPVLGCPTLSATDQVAELLVPNGDASRIRARDTAA